ncbi:DEAD/DEAH box helicase family protein [Clostridium sp. C2-6-12]|uniref:DEAD/DEAH box helicase n=1 Tax=Clostridium sp. C2-6-12 TaxID=2698832 RepID=UPI001371F977|nr:DEAD/DEAH box helicase family protein [Clostridium sp. C2-6-12]
MGYFFDTKTFIEGNKKLRQPQIEAYIKIRDYMNINANGEALVVLPTGTGKSGLISIAPFEVSKGRVLIITPGIVTKDSVVKSLHPMEENFWVNYDVIFDPEDMPIVEEYSSDMLDSSLRKCNFVITNIHKLYSENKKSLINRVSPDFFDMIIVDEAHHAPAKTWVEVLSYFKDAKKLYLTGTPYRGDKEPLPGELIHETKLSEVMALKYVKWLRKKTVNNSELYFTMPGHSHKYSKEEILELKDKEWVEKSVALSEACTLEVIKESIKNLKELKEISSDVPHKILAIGCSIKHAEDLKKFYDNEGLTSVIVHSSMSKEDIDNAFLKIDNNKCEVVISVNMLMEGYDHKYLTVLALFRPYRSLNAFAQIVGRVLRAIPDNEIKDFAIDNNAVVIYHEEIGLNIMWDKFSNEIEKSKRIPIKEYTFTDREYVERKIDYARIELDDTFISSEDSYLKDFDFNRLYEDARSNVANQVNDKKQELKSKGLSDEDIEMFLNIYEKKAMKGKKDEVDQLLISKRPELARKQAKEFLYKNANEAAQDLLNEKNIDPKSNSLYYKFKDLIYKLPYQTNNDGILVRYINTRISKKFGPVKDREPEMLYLSQKYMEEVVQELRRMI